MLIGYARVSTLDQNLELQRAALTEAGCEKVFEDKVSGTRADRPSLAKTLDILREGDTLVVWKLDRLGRSVKHLVDLVNELHNKHIQFKSLTDSIDTGTPSGRFFFHVMASLAEMERDLTVERTRAGLDVAKQLGRKGGRKPKMTDSKIESIPVVLGATIGLLMITTPALILGKHFAARVPTATIRYVAAGLFLLIGLWTWAEAGSWIPDLGLVCLPISGSIQGYSQAVHDGGMMQPQPAWQDPGHHASHAGQT